MQIPHSWLEFFGRIGIWSRPDFLCVDVEDAPVDNQLVRGLLMREVRGGYAKWAHFRCPRCSEHIQISIAGNKGWTLNVDWLRRPTLSPSIWQTGSCGAHFFVRGGHIAWCKD